MHLARPSLDNGSMMLMMTAAIVASVHFMCPTCGEDLLVAAGGLRCTNGHLTNIAKEGHIHLLPPTKGDASAIAANEALVRAQRAFYEAGGFAMQADAVAGEVYRALAASPDFSNQASGMNVLNAGCGEGLFMRRLAHRLQEEGVGVGGLWGTDTSKLAVRYAANRHKDAHFAVCSPHRLPFRDGSMDLVFSAFSPSPWEEFCRVLRPGGAVVVARAGRRHLNELARAAGEPAPDAAEPKQVAAGLAENYVRATSEEAYAGPAAASLLEMAAGMGYAAKPDELLVTDAGGGADGGGESIRLAKPVTVDVIVSTHRVWLGTGGEPL